MRLALLPGSHKPIPILLRRSTENGRAYRLRMESEAYLATWIVLKALLLHCLRLMNSETEGHVIKLKLSLLLSTADVAAVRKSYVLRIPPMLPSSQGKGPSKHSLGPVGGF